MENTNPIQVLKDRIIAWEHDAGESFTDYFMHDNVADRSWAFWLLGKGYTADITQSGCNFTKSLSPSD